MFEGQNIEPEATTPDEAEMSENTAAAQDVEAFDSETGALPAEPAPEEMIAQLQAELGAERLRYAELYDRFQRASAEFQNSRRRQEKQMAEAIERASTHVVKRLLPVLDDFDLAFTHVPGTLGDDAAAWVDGFRQIQRKLMILLDEEGIVPMPTDGLFDPTRHEAIGGEASDSVESGHILSTLRVGYEQAGRVLRPALVRVAQ